MYETDRVNLLVDPDFSGRGFQTSVRGVENRIRKSLLRKIIAEHDSIDYNEKSAVRERFRKNNVFLGYCCRVSPNSRSWFVKLGRLGKISIRRIAAFAFVRPVCRTSRLIWRISWESPVYFASRQWQQPNDAERISGRKYGDEHESVRQAGCKRGRENAEE